MESRPLRAGAGALRRYPQGLHVSPGAFAPTRMAGEHRTSGNWLEDWFSRRPAVQRSREQGCHPAEPAFGSATREGRLVLGARQNTPEAGGDLFRPRCLQEAVALAAVPQSTKCHQDPGVVRGAQPPEGGQLVCARCGRLSFGLQRPLGDSLRHALRLEHAVQNRHLREVDFGLPT